MVVERYSLERTALERQHTLLREAAAAREGASAERSGGRLATAQVEGAFTWLVEGITRPARRAMRVPRWVGRAVGITLISGALLVGGYLEATDASTAGTLGARGGGGAIGYEP